MIWLLAALASVPQPLTLDGRPFPLVRPYVSVARHTVMLEGDLQKAVCALKPGDRLRVPKGTYPMFHSCGAGTPELPIEVFFDRGAKAPGLEIRDSFWRVTGSTLGRVGFAAGANGVLLANNHLESVQVEGARDIEITANTIGEIRVARSKGVRIDNNTLAGSKDGIVLDDVERAVIRTNHLSGHAVAMNVLRATDLVIDHNVLDTTAPSGVAIAIEAGSDIRFVNNVIERYADAILVLGKTNVTIANNLVIDASRTAFVLRNPAAAKLFDFNVFTGSDALEAEIGGKTVKLSSALGKMPHSELRPGVTFLNRDLSRVAGLDTVDRGTHVEGIAFEGNSPDVGVAESKIAAATAKASENPPDVRARMPDRPLPPQPESKFPPPQQSEEEEKRTANRPGEPDVLSTEPAVFLDGAPFPEKKAYDPGFPAPRRTIYVSAEAGAAGLQDALCRLEPGDRLVLAAGIYAGSFRVAGDCRDGTAEAPIQVFARHAFLKAEGSHDVLTVERAHWQFWEVQIALLDSDAAGFVASGAGAHHIAIDQSHIYEGKGPAVRLASGASDVVLSNCHVHHANGIRIEAGTSRITLINNHIHHNRTAAVAIGGGSGASSREISIVGNRIHNDRGPALDLSNCDGVTMSRNRLSNYRPDEDTKSGGEAAIIRSGCRRVTFESNSVIEASTAVRVAGAEHLVLRRNYFENQLTGESTALLIERGLDIRFENNVVNEYREPFRVGTSSGISVANNLVLRPSTGWILTSPKSVAFFDYNVFGTEASLPAMIAGKPVIAVEWMKSHMPHSRVDPKAGLAGRDLGKIEGFRSVDAGVKLEGVLFRGAAPDIGVAEH